ncbi:response regulator transcription factor [Streptomyces sp. HC44]|uniref:Response regulator transcription factor n=1 Tax=Streptomyces scabichelini TaxID=2711217 RepID=A0A6G4VAK7_9ACTN|nr:response regulator transcription factor [Streptomyces scabichelini]NGO11152.1 response regulator transcription factor [Streptomyces scabichelini]
MSSIKIQLVDDEQIVLEGLHKLLDGFSEFSVVAVARDGASALRQLRVHRPHIVLMGLRLPGMGGVETTRAIRRESAHVRIVFLASHQQPVYVREAFQAGANAYLSRAINAGELRDALVTVYREGAVFSPAIASHLLQLVSGQPEDGASPISRLTGRERQILSMIADDHETGHIARSLGISPKTVRNYLSRIYAKLGTPNRVQTALYAKRSFGYHDTVQTE